MSLKRGMATGPPGLELTASDLATENLAVRITVEVNKIHRYLEHPQYYNIPLSSFTNCQINK